MTISPLVMMLVNAAKKAYDAGDKEVWLSNEEFIDALKGARIDSSKINVEQIGGSYSHRIVYQGIVYVTSSLSKLPETGSV